MQAQRDDFIVLQLILLIRDPRAILNSRLIYTEYQTDIPQKAKSKTTVMTITEYNVDDTLILFTHRLLYASEVKRTSLA